MGHVKDIKVYKKAIIGLLSSGNELVECHEDGELADGKIRDSNKPMMKGLLIQSGVSPNQIRDFGSMSDDSEDIHTKMQEALKEVDILVTTGGVSMGKRDLIKPYVEATGEVFFGRLNMKPGKPTTFGRIGGALVFALPGNPVSCFVTFQLFVLPSIKLLSGSSEDSVHPLMLKVSLQPAKVKLDAERPEYHRAVAVQDASTAKVFAFSTGSQLSSRLLSAKSVNCLVYLP